MSKSKGNVVDPQDMVEKYGADTCRLFTLFAAPPERDMEWQDLGIEGMYRFVGRLFRFVTRNLERVGQASGRPSLADASAQAAPSPADARALRKLHQTVKKVTDDFETRWHFNTSIAALMELLNELQALEPELTGAALPEILEETALLLGPFTPYLAQELWEELGHSDPVIHHPWPSYDPELAREEEAEIVVQVNGRVRGHVRAPFGTPREELERRALQEPKSQPFLAGKQIARIIVVPDRLVNIVVKG